MTFVSRRARPRTTWTKLETDLLREMCESGNYSYTSMGQILRRPIASIRCKMSAMGLVYCHDYVAAKYGTYAPEDRMPGRALSIMIFPDGTSVRYEDWA